MELQRLYLQNFTLCVTATLQLSIIFYMLQPLKYLITLLLLPSVFTTPIVKYVSYPTTNLQALPISITHFNFAVSAIHDNDTAYFELIIHDSSFNCQRLTHFFTAILLSHNSDAFIKVLLTRNPVDAIYLQMRLGTLTYLNSDVNLDEFIVSIYRSSSLAIRRETHFLYLRYKRWRIVVLLFSEYNFSSLSADTDTEKDTFLAVWVELKNANTGFKPRITQMDTIRTNFMYYCMLRESWEDVIIMLDVIDEVWWTREIGTTVIRAFGCAASPLLLVKVLHAGGYDLEVVKKVKETCKKDSFNEIMMSAYLLKETVEGLTKDVERNTKISSTIDSI